KQPAVAMDPTVGDRQSNYATVAVFAVMIIIGGLVGSNAVNGTTSFSAAGVSGAYPSTYSPKTRPDDVYRVVDTVGTGAEFDISSPSGTDPVLIANQLAGSRSTDYSLYKVMSSGKATVAGQSAVTQRFAFVESNGL